MRNKYDIFTKPQADNVKLLESQWLELQQIVSWIESWFAYGMRYMEQPPKIGKIALRCFEISASPLDSNSHTEFMCVESWW